MRQRWRKLVLASELYMTTPYMLNGIFSPYHPIVWDILDATCTFPSRGVIKVSSPTLHAGIHGAAYARCYIHGHLYITTSLSTFQHYDKLSCDTFQAVAKSKQECLSRFFLLCRSSNSRGILSVLVLAQRI